MRARFLPESPRRPPRRLWKKVLLLLLLLLEQRRGAPLLRAALPGAGEAEVHVEHLGYVPVGGVGIGRGGVLEDVAHIEEGREQPVGGVGIGGGGAGEHMVDAGLILLDLQSTYL